MKSYSTREVARILGISVRTAQLWVEDGRLQAWKTPGGHRRILVESVNRLLSGQAHTAFPTTAAQCILIVHSDAQTGQALAQVLANRFPEYHIEVSNDAVDGLLKMVSQAPEILIVDRVAITLDKLQALIRLPDALPHCVLFIVIGGDDIDLPPASPLLQASVTLLPSQASTDELARLIDAYQRGRHHARSKV